MASAGSKQVFPYILRHTNKLVVIAVVTLIASLALLGLGYYNYANTLGFTVFILFVIISALLLGREFTERKFEHDENETGQRPEEENLKDETKHVLISVAAGLILLIIAFRTLIVHPGIVNAISILWPKFGIVEFLPFNPLMGYTAGDDRFFITGMFSSLPLGFIDSIAISSVIQTLLDFAFVYLIALLVSRTVYNALNLRMNRAFFYTVFGIVALMNPVFLVDGWVLSIAALLILYVLMVVFRNLNSSGTGRNDFYKIGYAASFIMFLDPRYFILLFISLTLVLASSALYGKFKKIFKLILKSIVIWVPLGMLLVVMFHFTATFDSSYGRTATVGVIESFSVNSNYISVWSMLGNWWPSLVFASPQIISVAKSQIYSLKTYGFSNPMMVLFPGWFQVLWTILFGMYSIVALISLFFLVKERNYSRRLSIFLVPFIVSFVLVIGGSVSLTPVVQLYSDLTRIPFIGGIWGITIAVSPWLQSLLFAFFLLYFSYSISKMFGHDFEYRGEVKKRTLKRNKRLEKYIVVSIVVILTIAPSWQFAFPEYSLGAKDPGLPGNQVAATGTYYPSYAPSSFTGFYSYLASSSNLTYSVFSNDKWYVPEKWDSGILSVGPPGVPPSENFSGLFSFIYHDNLYRMVAPLSEMYGVKYFFIDNSTVENVTPLINFLKESHLREMYSGKNLSVFENSNASNVMASNLLVNYSNESNISLLEAYLGLNSVSIRPAFLAGSNISLELSDTASINHITLLNYQDMITLRNYLPVPFYNTTRGNVNSTFINLNDGWNIFNPGSHYYANYSAGRGFLMITPQTASGQPTTGNVILDYKGPMFDGAKDILVPNYNDTVVVVSGEIKYSISGTDSGIGLYFPTNNVSLKNSGGAEVTLPKAGSNITENFSLTLPGGTRTFSASLRINGLNGTVDISGLNISYSFTNDLSVYVGNKTSIPVKLSPGSYEVVENGLNGNFKDVNIIRAYSVNKEAETNLSTRNMSYLSYVIIVPSNIINQSSRPELSNLSYDNLTATLSFEASGGTKYVLVSYNPQYEWHTSANMKFLGTNVLGIQIYEILREGESSLYIPGSFALTIVEIVTAIALDAVIPIWLFILPRNIIGNRKIKI